MEILLLNLFVFLRPVLLIEFELTLAGLNTFEIAAIVLMGMLVATFVYSASLNKELSLTSLDLWMAVFVLWGVVVFVTYFDRAILSEAAKLLLPIATLTLVKNMIASREQYRRLLFLMILGFTIPLAVSFVLIMQGKGVEFVNYWTGLPRYAGAFGNAHQLGHSMALLLMCMVIYAAMANQDSMKGANRLVTRTMLLLFGPIAALALVCLYYSYARTPMLGLAIFGTSYLYFLSKRVFLAWLIAATIAVLTVIPLDVLFYDFQEVSEHELAERGGSASGRAEMWEHSITEFGKLPLDRMIGGVGIGNLDRAAARTGEQFIDSHNEFLNVLTQTGIVGLGIFLVIQILILKRILDLQGHERYVFLALFLAVTFMNFVSNSYVSRFGIAQLFYVIIAYIDNPRLGSRQSA